MWKNSRLTQLSTPDSRTPQVGCFPVSHITSIPQEQLRQKTITNIENQTAFTVLIPARDEQESLEDTVRRIVETFAENDVTDYEILIVDDNSSDATGDILKRLSIEIAQVRYLRMENQGGFGRAVCKGLDHYRGDAVAIVMADGAESPDNVMLYYKKIKDDASCVFGSRFADGGSITGYPRLKFVLNRWGNYCISRLFRVKHDDITNGFKAYRRDVIEDVKPLRSEGFELSVELPLKVILNRASFAQVPISWKKRTGGSSKFALWRTSARYLFTLLRLQCCFLLGVCQSRMRKKG